MTFQGSGRGMYYDPVYGYIPLPSHVRSAMDLESMQRIDGVEQLSVLHMLFRGGHHTRFEHAIGTYHLATVAHQILSQKAQANPDWPRLNNFTLLTVQLGALFHDVGTGPLGDVFELYCKRHSEYCEYLHERLTHTIIADEKSDIGCFIGNLFTTLDGPKERFKELLTREAVAAVAGQRQVPLNGYQFLADIIGATFGVDRLDYLVRDSHHTGVKSGNIDVWEVINAYVLRKTGEDGGWSLGLEVAAADAVEALVTSRDITYRRLYFDPLGRSIEEMLVRCLEIEGIAPEQWAQKRDEDLLCFLASSQNSEVKRLLSRYRLRHLLDVLPVEITPDKHFDQSAHAATTAKRKDMSAWLSAERQLGMDLGLIAEMNEFFVIDLEPIPAVKHTDLETPHFLTQAGEQKSLLEIRPHLDLLFGKHTLPGGKIRDLREQYVNAISKMSVSLSSEYLDRRISEAKKECGEGREAIFQWLDTNIAAPLANACMGFFGVMQEEEQKAMVADLLSGIRSYINSKLDDALPRADAREPFLEFEHNHRTEIRKIAKAFQHYGPEPVDKDAVKEWLDQFATNRHRELALKLLMKSRQYFYPTSRIHSCLRVIGDECEVLDGKVHLVGHGRLGKSGVLLTVPAEKMISMRPGGKQMLNADDLARVLDEYKDGDTIFFTDDFIGTGDQATTFFKAATEGWGYPVKKREQVRRKGAIILEERQAKKLSKCDIRFFFLTGFANGSGEFRKKTGVEAVIIEPLTDEDRAFHERSSIWASEDEREEARVLCRDIGQSLCRSPLGYGNSQSLVSFQHNTPNDSLPILWAAGKHEGLEWKPLLPRMS